MKTRFVSFRVHFTNLFLIEQDGRLLLIDTGNRKQLKNIAHHFRAAGFELSALKYIFLTHTHYDHAGSVSALKKLTGAKVIVHNSEADNLGKGFTPIPKGTTTLFKFISFMGRKGPGIEKLVASYQPVKPDILFESELDLKHTGFDARIIHTPGHTKGSSSLVMGESAFVGDVMFNFRGNIFPGFADNGKQVVESWKKLLDLDVQWFYPAHGKRVSREHLEAEAERKGIISSFHLRFLQHRCQPESFRNTHTQ